jgi:hypothetical protein
MARFGTEVVTYEMVSRLVILYQTTTNKKYTASKNLSKLVILKIQHLKG